jgi:hypothetical protein
VVTQASRDLFNKLVGIKKESGVDDSEELDGWRIEGMYAETSTSTSTSTPTAIAAVQGDPGGPVPSAEVNDESGSISSSSSGNAVKKDVDVLPKTGMLMVKSVRAATQGRG